MELLREIFQKISRKNMVITDDPVRVQIQQQDLGCLCRAIGRSITVEGVFSLHTYSSVHSDGRHEFKYGGEAQKAERTYGYKVTCHQLRNQEPLATQPAPVRGMRL
jgi:hypothetical protein